RYGRQFLRQRRLDEVLRSSVAVLLRPASQQDQRPPRIRWWVFTTCQQPSAGCYLVFLLLTGFFPSCASNSSFWARAAESTNPMASMMASMAEPPEEINGSGTPITGKTPVTVPRFTKVWPMTQDIRQPMSTLVYMSLARAAMRYIARANRMNITRTNSTPINPNSSPKIEKMKSFWASGTYDHFMRDWPAPTPNQPPEAKACKPMLAW